MEFTRHAGEQVLEIGGGIGTDLSQFARAGSHVTDLDLSAPPDLGLEIDVTHSSLNRLAIYAALRVPEVWRLENMHLVCYLLDAGQYIVSITSLALPGLKVADLEVFLKLSGTIDENAIVRQFREWVRNTFQTGPNP